ncbi:AAA family ATPase [Streptomyces sp. NBC_00063]|uniref:AAA family ATPase n=1 Tax=Streptomyces sp. NBC_00063 TaxID=2975638 RepID=UPI00224DD5C6|nr:AAA family ATPase [Streptomyces sp. NBC_00063]MCX5443898.1 AAA family ATPase [Streptomyces sp. NBC_00063]
MNWTPYYTGTGSIPEQPQVLPPPPPWRAPTRKKRGAADAAQSPSPASTYRADPGLVDAVNAALHLRRPLLLTGPAGSGKSSVIEQIAAELGLGRVLRWHITSRSTLADALYRYDALGRIHAYNLRAVDRPAASRNGRAVRRATRAARDDIGDFVQLGPLGTALVPDGLPRALLIDEIDKSDLDLPSDLLDVLERGRFEIPELARHSRRRVTVRTADPGIQHEVTDGLVECEEYPVIVLTSNGERDFPAPFLRRCVRFDMPVLTVSTLTGIVEAHLEKVEEDTTHSLVNAFVDRLNRGENLAVDQLLSAVHLLRGNRIQDDEQRTRLQELLLQGLGRG